MKDIFEELNSLYEDYEDCETVPLDEAHPYYKQLMELKNRGYSISTSFIDEDPDDLDWFSADLPFDTRYKNLNCGSANISLGIDKKVEVVVCFGTDGDGADEYIPEEEACEYLDRWKKLIEKAHKDKIEIFGE